jgi:PEP-CTERM motif
VTMTTGLTMTGAWFGRNEYFGFGGGADQVTIVAMSGATDLRSVVFNLPPEIVPGVAPPMSFVDLSSFAGLSGITGYRIDRRAPSQFAVNWVADDFTFATATVAAVPEPGTLALMASALPALAVIVWRKRRGLAQGRTSRRNAPSQE